MSACFSPGAINGLALKNRFIKAATFEGMTPGGIPSPRLKDFHCRIAQGGVAMTTLAYCAPEPDGRLHENTMFLDEHVRESLSSLIMDIQRAGTKISGQLTHCGSFTRNRQLRGKRSLGPSAGLNLLGMAHGMPFCSAMRTRDIDALVENFGRAAAFMKSVGFDCVELHFGHGYALCQFISPKTNRRTDEYGGSLENRMRLPLRVLEAVRDAVGDELPIIGKISLTEGARNGLKYDEAVEVARMLDGAGIDGIVTSGGSSTMNPMIMFRGDNISKALLEHEKNPLARLGIRLMRRRMFPDYAYRELYFLDHAKRVRDAVQCKVIYIGGAATRASFDTLMAQGFDFIQLGRALLADPDCVLHAQRVADYVNPCTHCNRCVGYIDHPEGIRCVL